MPDVCENCETRPSISVTGDDVELCAECELALMDEMASHEDDCGCTAWANESGESCPAYCEMCTCGLAARVERRKEWLRELIAQGRK